MGSRLLVGVMAVGFIVAPAALRSVPHRFGFSATPGLVEYPRERALAARRAPADLRVGNLLVNPGFEGPFSLHGSSELVVGDGWTPWFDESQVRPEFKDEPYARLRPDGGVHGFSLRVFHGVNVQKFFTFSATHDAGIYQQVQVTPGERLRFSIWVQAWTSDCDDPCISPRTPCRHDSPNSHGTYRVQVGIETGGAAPQRLGAMPPDTVKWSDPIVFEAYDRWFPLSLEAEAEGDQVTVYTRGNPIWPVKHNDTYWDDARLEVVDETEPTMTPSPTTITVTPSPTTPSATPTSTAVVDVRAFLPLTVQRHAQREPTTTPTVPSEITPTATPLEGYPTDIIPSPTSTSLPRETAPPPPADTATPTPTATLDERCRDLASNGDFETGDPAGWEVGPTGPAEPQVSGAELGPEGGDYSLRVGLTTPLADLGPSWAWAVQEVLLSERFVTATVRFDVRALSQETDGGDWQMLALRDGEGRPLKLLYWQPGLSTAAWERVAVDLGAPGSQWPYVGPLRLSADVFNDGDGGPSALFLDNVRLVVCRAAANRVDGPRDPVPPGADVRIEYPIRAHPGQENFNQPTCDELEFESLRIRNYGTVPVAVGGWTLEDRETNSFVFPPFTLAPDDFLRVWTKDGDDTTDGHTADLYWKRTDPVWDNNSDEAVIRDDDGTEVARRGYP